jgi:hypothetical protein
LKPLTQILLTFAVIIPADWLGYQLGLPFPLTMVLMFLALNYSIFAYNSRAMTVLRPIPERGYGRRREVLERDESVLFNLGFRKTDEFYVKSVSDVVVYAYEHRSEPVVLCAYHAGLATFWDFVTRFEGDVSLLTTTSGSAGAVKRPARRPAQILKNLDHAQMLEAHRGGVAFLERQGLRPTSIPPHAFRQFFVTSVNEFYDCRRSRRFFLLRFMFGFLTAAGQEYRKPLEQQYPTGLPREALAG